MTLKLRWCLDILISKLVFYCFGLIHLISCSFFSNISNLCTSRIGTNLRISIASIIGVCNNGILGVNVILMHNVSVLLTIDSTVRTLLYIFSLRLLRLYFKRWTIFLINLLFWWWLIFKIRLWPFGFLQIRWFFLRRS